MPSVALCAVHRGHDGPCGHIVTRGPHKGDLDCLPRLYVRREANVLGEPSASLVGVCHLEGVVRGLGAVVGDSGLGAVEAVALVRDDDLAYVILSGVFIRTVEWLHVRMRGRALARGRVVVTASTGSSRGDDDHHCGNRSEYAEVLDRAFDWLAFLRSGSESRRKESQGWQGESGG